MKKNRFLISAIIFTISLYASSAFAIKVPDLTKGEKLDRTQHYMIGPLGIATKVWRTKAGGDWAHPIRQMLVHSIDKGSPAEGHLEVGDVILGVRGGKQRTLKKFHAYPSGIVAKAITEAESANPAAFDMLIWRKGREMTVKTRLKSFGPYSETAPYKCPKSKRILREGLQKLYERNEPGEAGLALLMFVAGNDPTNPNNRKYRAKAKEWAHKLIVNSVQDVPRGPWQISHTLIALTEYYMQTKDKAVFPTIAHYAERFAIGQSWYGTTGHRFADNTKEGSSNGPMGGYGAINNSALSGFLGMLLARKAGVKSQRVDEAIRRAEILFSSYAFRSVIPYGEHPFITDSAKHDINGKSGMAAIAFSLMENRQAEAKWFALMAARAYDQRAYAHAGPYLAQVYDPLGAAVAGPRAINFHLKRITDHTDMNRRFDGTIEYLGKTRYAGWTDEATTLLMYALPLKQTFVTGKGRPKSLDLTNAEFSSLEESAWFNFGKAKTDKLFEILGGWSVPMRNSAGFELSSRVKLDKGARRIMSRLHKTLKRGDKNASLRAGVCRTLGLIGDPDSIELLVKALEDEDAYVRYVAAMALKSTGRHSLMPYMNRIFKIAETSLKPYLPLIEDDPLQLAHGALAVMLFGKKGGVLKNNLNGIDKEKLWPAVRALAKTPMGAARSSLSNLYRQLSKEEMLELGDTIIDSVRLRSPGDAMFAGTIRDSGVDLLQRNSMREALPLIQYSGNQTRFYQKYDRSLLKLTDMTKTLQQAAETQFIWGFDASALFNVLKKDPVEREFNQMKAIESIVAKPTVVKMPAKTVELSVKAHNHSVSSTRRMMFKWRKVYGPGKVSFSSNKSYDSSKTTVTFEDEKPGKYKFEASLIDDLGFYKVSESVEVLYGKSGLAVKNRAPISKSFSFRAIVGVPVIIPFRGKDPDGDEVSFIIEGEPQHGRLRWTNKGYEYTASYTEARQEVLSFKATDGSLFTDGKVKVLIQPRINGITVYEGFDYADGTLRGKKGGKGFKGPWKYQGGDDAFKVISRKITPFGLPAVKGSLVGGHTHLKTSRRLDTRLLNNHGMVKNGGEMWFSFNLWLGNHWHHQNSKFAFGFQSSKDPKKHLGVKIWGACMTLSLNDKQVGSLFGSGGKRQRGYKYPKNTPLMIIGKVTWGATSKQKDTINMYRVYDLPKVGPIVIDTPFCSHSGKYDKSMFEEIYYSGGGADIDEIKIGKTRQLIMLGGGEPVKGR